MTLVLRAPDRTILLSAGDRIHSGHYRVTSRYAHAVNYLGSGGAFLFAVTPEQGAGPLNVVTPDPGSLPDDLVIRNRNVVLAGEAVRPQAVFDSRLRLSLADPGLFCRHTHILRSSLLEHGSPEWLVFLLEEKQRGPSGTSRAAFTEQLGRGVEILRRREFLVAAGLVRGCGIGLTPAGDDFNAGMLFALNLLLQCGLLVSADLPRRVYEVARGGNPLVNCFLELARDGRFFKRLKDLVQAMEGPGPEDVRRCAIDVIDYGATSGADLLAGFLLTLEAVLNPSSTEALA